MLGEGRWSSRRRKQFEEEAGGAGFVVNGGCGGSKMRKRRASGRGYGEDGAGERKRVIAIGITLSLKKTSAAMASEQK
eukprot:1313489-Pleurochrysis_carterae.AAC.1